MSRRRRVVMLLLVAVPTGVVGIAWGGWTLSKSPTYQLFGELVTRVETLDPVVALTFDDGPDGRYTASVLDLLARERARATFFVVGSAVSAEPELARRILAEGHELGNHSYTHKRMVLKTPGFVQREIDATDRVIRAAGQTGTIPFRPPFSKRLVVLPWVLARANRTTILADVQPDSLGAIADDPAGMVEHVKAHIRAGSILLMHVELPSREASRQALPGIIDAVRAKGLRFVTVTELIRSGSP